MIIDCVSDLHGEFPILKGGDLLIVAGDLTACDLGHQYFDFRHWLVNLEYERKIVIAGNHDGLIEEGRWVIDPPDGFEYLCDSGTEFNGLKIWGSPWTKRFEGMNPHCMAFTVDSDSDLSDKWDLIPTDTDILVTHSPPYGILDYSMRSDEYCGSPSLKTAVLRRVVPRLHVFGHIHENGGNADTYGPTTFINASIMNEDYEAVNKPVRIEI